MESINQSYARGVAHVAAVYGVKLAFFETLKSHAMDIGKDIATSAIGSPGKAYKQYQAGTLFHPEEGMLHHSRVLWPNMPASLPKPGPGEAPHSLGAQLKNRAAQAGVWANRLQNVGMPAYAAYQALNGKGDPNEGRLTNALSAIGQGLGNAYGAPVFGMLGAPYVGRAGAFLGKQVGRLLGSKPRYTNPYGQQPQQPDTQQYPEEMTQQPRQPQTQMQQQQMPQHNYYRQGYNNYAR